MLTRRHLMAAGAAGAMAGLIGRGWADTIKLTFCSWGGALSDLEKTALLDPFGKTRGFEVVPASPTNYAKLKAMVEAGPPEWDLVDVGAETLSRDPALEFQREEPVIPAGDHPGGHVRPSLDGAGLAEGNIRLGILVILPRGRHLRRHVVQEVGGQVELGGICARLRGRDTGRIPAGVAPPVARGFTG